MTRTPYRGSDSDRVEDLDSAIAARLETMRGLTKREIARAAADIATLVSRSQPTTNAARPGSWLVDPTPTARPAGSRGRLLHNVDVRARLPTAPDGSQPSAWYVRRVMNEIGAFRLGKWMYVYEADLEDWLSSRLDD